MTAFRKNQGEKTEAAKQSIICLIRDLKLKTGDKLPTQNELRLKLGVGSTTIQRAIDTLTESGILEIRPHKGVFLKNHETDGFVARHIGLVSMWRTFSPSNAAFMQCLQLRLHQNACQCKLFMRKFPDMTKTDSLSYFEGLKRCIEQKEIEGLITTVSFDYEAWDFFRKHNLPVLSLGSATYNKGFKVTIDYNLEGYFLLAAKRGYKRPALLQCGFPLTEKIRDIYIQKCPLAPEIYCRFLQPDMLIADKAFEWTEKLKDILHEFAAMPENTRPDVLFIPDDIIMNITYREILEMRLNGSDWMPYFIFLTNKHVPVMPHGTIKGDYFEYDAMAEADVAAKLLIDIICGRKKEPETIYIKPKLYTYN